MKKDFLIGTIGTIGTLSLNTVNVWLACIAGVLTVAILVFKLRREWRHRNKPPTDL